MLWGVLALQLCGSLAAKAYPELEDHALLALGRPRAESFRPKSLTEASASPPSRKLRCVDKTWGHERHPRRKSGGSALGDEDISITYTSWNDGTKCKHPVYSWDGVSSGSSCLQLCTDLAQYQNYTENFCCAYQDDKSSHDCHISASGDTDTKSSESWKKSKGQVAVVGTIYYSDWNFGTKCKHPVQSWDHISGGSQCEDQCTSYADSSSYDDSFCCGYQHDSSPHTCHISANGDTSTTSSGSWKKVKGSFTPQSESAGSANCHAICNDFVDKALCESSDYTLCVGGCDVYAAGACVEDVLDYTSCYNEQVKWCNNNCYDTIVEPCITKAAEPCYDSCVDNLESTCELVIEESIKEIGEDNCDDLCAEAAAEAELAGGGPEDPAADALALTLASSCAYACSIVVHEDVDMASDSTDFAKDMCQAMGC